MITLHREQQDEFGLMIPTRADLAFHITLKEKDFTCNDFVSVSLASVVSFYLASCTLTAF